MRYIKKAVEIDAVKWFKCGDHPIVEQYWASPIAGVNQCKYCHKELRIHGWVPTLERGHCVCPGDWIITGVQGEKYPCKPDVFEMTYEEVGIDKDIDERLIGLKNYMDSELPDGCADRVCDNTCPLWDIEGICDGL